jgi:transcriptional regulator with XRE-family HTH domain
MERSTLTNDFGTMVRRKRKELKLTQQQVAQRIMTDEDPRPITQSYLADIEAGHYPNPRPHLIEEFARALGIDRYVLYLAARTVPPEVAEQLARLTIEEREAAWAVFMRAIKEAEAEKKAREQGKGKAPRGGGKKD